MSKHLMKWVALLGVALVLAACGSSTTKTGGTPTSTPIPLTATSAPLPPAGTISAMIPGMGAITGQNDGYGMAADCTAVWIYNGETGNLFRIDPKTNQIVATISVGLGCPPPRALWWGRHRSGCRLGDGRCGKQAGPH